MNEAKERLLGVPTTMLAAHGAVSEEVAGAMAEGARRALGSDIAVGVTGIAGPDGGTAEKPVGTVCFGLAAADHPTVTRRYQLWGNREWVKLLSSQIALDWVRRHLVGAPSSRSVGAAPCRPSSSGKVSLRVMPAMPDERWRCFVAVTLGEPTRAALIEYLERLRATVAGSRGRVPRIST